MSNQTILITGGSGKFGRRLVSHFLRKGDTIVATVRQEASLQSLVREFSWAPDRFVPLEVDLTKEQEAGRLAGKLTNLNLLPDSLVNNARNLEFLRMEHDGTVSRQNFAAELLLDVISPYELTMAFANVSGSPLRCVVNVGSQYGTVAANPALYSDYDRESPIHYSVAKAALGHLTRELSVRLASRRIRVNCIAYGGVEGRVDEAFRKRYRRLCPIGRMLTEDEIIGPVEFLVSDASSGMTGHVMAVDGGWTVW